MEQRYPVFKSRMTQEPLGYLNSRIITDRNDRAIDYLLLDHNETLSDMLQTKLVSYKKASELFENGWLFREDELEIFSKVAHEGTNAHLQETYRGYVLNIHAYSPNPGHFVLLISQSEINTSSPLSEIFPDPARLSDVIQALTATGSWVYHKDTSSFVFSPQLHDLLQLESEMVTFSNLLEFVHAEDRNPLEKSFHHAIDAGITKWELQYRVVGRKSGQIKYLLQKNFLHPDDPNIVYGVLQDITQQKIAQQESELQRSQLENILKVSPVGMGVAVDRKFIMVNPAFCELTQYSISELEGETSLKLFPDQAEYEKVGDEFIRQIHQHGICRLETRWKRKDGSCIDVNIAASPINRKDLSQGVAITVIEITQAKQTERLMKARIRLSAFANCHNVDQLLQATLDEIEKLTESQIGFYYSVDEASGMLSLQQLSSKTIKKYGPVNEQILHGYPIEEAGELAKAIHERQPVMHNHVHTFSGKSRPMPAGLMAIDKEIMIPVIRNKKIVSLLAVGNKPDDYTREDLAIASKLADMAWDIVDRKMVSDALKASEKLYRQLFDNMTQGFSLYDVLRDENNEPHDYRYVAANPAFETLLGIKAGNILGKTMKEFFPDAEGYWFETFGQVTRTGEPIQFQNYFQTLDKYYNLWIFKPGEDQVAVIFTDVTEQKRAEETILKLTKGIEQSPAVVLITDTRGTIEYVNPKFTEVTGYTPEEALGQNARIQSSGIHGKEFYGDIWKTITAGEDWTGIIANKRKTGEIYWESVIISPIKDDEGVIKNFISIKENITHRVEAERTLSNSERKYRLIFENVPVGIFYLSREGIITDCNHNFVEIIGSSREKLIGLNYTRLPDQRIVNLYYYAMQGRSATFEGDYSSVTANKTTSVRVMLSPVMDDNGEVEGAIGLVEDRTAQIQQELLEKQVALAKEAIEFKQNFLANMSHEIRTPLTGIIGMLDILKETRLDQAQMEYLSIMENTSENLMEIVNQVLDFSKIEAGKLKIYIQDFDFHKLIRDKVQAFSKISKNEIEVKACIDDNVPAIIAGDKGRLSQVINNLMNNAIKFTEKGKITISVFNEGALRKKLTLPGNINFDSPIKIRVIISDTGIGISPDRKENLFEPFTQIHFDPNRIHTGTGLGLAICKQLVELHGGEIGFTSELGSGSSFYFTFIGNLCSKQRQDEIIPDVEDVSSKLAGKRILMAEDKKVNQKVFYIILRSMGFSVTFTDNGQQLLEKFKPGLFDVILMDIQMPIMDGITATQKLKQMHKTLPPIIGLSANAFEGDREKYMLAGMDEYITKPLKPNDLVEVLQKLKVI